MRAVDVDRAALDAFQKGRLVILVGSGPGCHQAIQEYLRAVMPAGEYSGMEMVEGGLSGIRHPSGGRIITASQVPHLMGLSSPDGGYPLVVPVWGFEDAEGGSLALAVRQRGWR